MEKRAHNVEDTHGFAAEYIAALVPEEGAATIVALSGELGAGKTTFAQAAAASLGVRETVNSPTFVIQKVYELTSQKWRRLIHMDAYRLKDKEELRKIGWDELIAESENLIIIEWPEHVPGALSQSARQIQITHGEGAERTITYG